MDFTNDGSIFCFGFQCRSAWLLSMDVQYQVGFLHGVEDGIKLLDILDSIVRVGRNLARVNFKQQKKVSVLQVVPRLGIVSPDSRSATDRSLTVGETLTPYIMSDFAASAIVSGVIPG